MAFYENTESFYEAMRALFERVLEEPHLLEGLTRARAVIQLNTSEPEGVLALDGRSSPPNFLVGESLEAAVDLSVSTTADTLHRVWLSEIRLRDAYAGGLVRVECSPLKLLTLMPLLTDLFRYVESIYADTLRARGRL